MLKCLFISDFLLAKEQGAKRLTHYHLYSLQDIVGIDNVDIVALNSSEKTNNKKYLFIEPKREKKDKLVSILQNIPYLMSKDSFNRILKICKQNCYDFIFIDHSIYGSLVKCIKNNCRSKVICFFHGIIRYQNEQFKKSNKTSLFFFLPQFNMDYNEKLTVEYSDVCVLLNERDNDNLYRYYKKRTSFFLPEYAVDSANIKKICKSDFFEILFVGGFFWPNVHGIRWFCKNVMPSLPDDVRLNIVGNGMETLSSELSSDRIYISGYVPSLDDYYNNADLVIGPIFEGEGMKTKTCEAFMYGKLYYGTKEAFEGYCNMNQYTFNTKEEFINAILSLKNKKIPKFHPEMRALFENCYSVSSSKQRFLDVLKSINCYL